MFFHCRYLAMASFIFATIPVSFPHVTMLSIKSRFSFLATSAVYFMNRTYVPCSLLLPFIPVGRSLVSLPSTYLQHGLPEFSSSIGLSYFSAIPMLRTKHQALLLLAYPFRTWRFHERNMVCHISEVGADVLGFRQ
jgi:hypothetical protein